MNNFIRKQNNLENIIRLGEPCTSHRREIGNTEVA
jgi:hypothetical protein